VPRGRTQGSQQQPAKCMRTSCVVSTCVAAAVTTRGPPPGAMQVRSAAGEAIALLYHSSGLADIDEAEEYEVGLPPAARMRGRDMV